MSKTEFVRARIEPELKHNVEEILSELGLTTTQAITLFFKQLELQKGLPFPIQLPNQETRETFEKTDRGEELTDCQDVDDMFRKLDI